MKLQQIQIQSNSLHERKALFFIYRGNICIKKKIKIKYDKSTSNCKLYSMMIKELKNKQVTVTDEA